jgi:hypothetical protein
MYCYRAWIKGYVWAGMMMEGDGKSDDADGAGYGV